MVQAHYTPSIQAEYEPRGEFQGPMRDEYDVVIIGAGPAGSTLAALLAEYGHSVLALERHTLPRFHVGESLIPETYWPLQRLGLIEQLKQSAYPKKFSVQFVSDGWKESAPFYFDMHSTHESSQTWQIERADFDLMLVENAVAKGATVRTGVQVLDLLMEGDRAVGVKVKVRDGDDAAQTREIKAKVVADASGTAAFLASRLGLKQSDPRLQKGTIWTYFKGACRDAGKDEGATLIMQTEGKKSWFWYIPLRNDIVSVGCTGAMNYMFPKGARPEETFAGELQRCPAMERRVSHAEQCVGYFTTKDYSYRSSRAAGPGWVLVGDAFGFIDPVYSSGVYLAMRGGEFVADAIHAAIEKNDTSAEMLGHWQNHYVTGLENFKKLVYAFYTPGFSFGDFLREHPEYHRHLVDILIGNVFAPHVSEIFDAMGDITPPDDREVTAG